MQQSKTYCPLVYHQLTVDFKNRADPCCQAELKTTLNNYQTAIQEIKSAIEANERHTACQQCWKDEDLKLESLRQSSILGYQNVSPTAGIVSMDLRVTNKCNLACSMCNENASSLWGRMKGKDTIRNIDTSEYDQIIAMSGNIKKLSIQGGEPFYGDDFINLVNAMPNKKNIALEIFTNVVTAPPDLIKQWQEQYKSILIIASVDGVEEVFEDIRWPASWSKLNRKLDVLYSFLGRAVIFNYTLQNSNLLCVKRFVDWRNEKYPESLINFSPLSYPRPLEFTNVDEATKQAASSMFESITATKDPERLRLDGLKKVLLNSSTDETKLNAAKKYQERLAMLRSKTQIK